MNPDIQELFNSEIDREDFIFIATNLVGLVVIEHEEDNLVLTT